MWSTEESEPTLWRGEEEKVQADSESSCLVRPWCLLLVNKSQRGIKSGDVCVGFTTITLVSFECLECVSHLIGDVQGEKNCPRKSSGFELKVGGKS